MFDDRSSAVTKDRKALRGLSRASGMAMLSVCILQLLASFAVLRLPGMGDALWLNVAALLSGATILTGALLGKSLLGAKLPAPVPFKANAPESIALVIAGAALCLMGNLASSMVQQLAERAGIAFQGGPADTAPESLPALAAMLISIALVPALAEELLLRGVLLPPLRRFGDGFAVVSTAVLFALLHQNMEQAPMAFVSGLALGWVYVRSGRLSAVMVVHFWNNAASVLLSYLPRYVGESRASAATSAYALALITTGLLLCLALYLKGLRRPRQKPCLLSVGSRIRDYFFGSISMVFSLAFFIAIIIMNTEF